MGQSEQEHGGDGQDQDQPLGDQGRERPVGGQVGERPGEGEDERGARPGEELDLMAGPANRSAARYAGDGGAQGRSATRQRPASPKWRRGHPMPEGSTVSRMPTDRPYAGPSQAGLVGLHPGPGKSGWARSVAAPVRHLSPGSERESEAEMR